jgi:hypothetical protein
MDARSPQHCQADRLGSGPIRRRAHVPGHLRRFSGDTLQLGRAREERTMSEPTAVSGRHWLPRGATKPPPGQWIGRPDDWQCDICDARQRLSVRIPLVSSALSLNPFHFLGEVSIDDPPGQVREVFRQRETSRGGNEAMFPVHAGRSDNPVESWIAERSKQDATTEPYRIGSGAVSRRARRGRRHQGSIQKKSVELRWLGF